MFVPGGLFQPSLMFVERLGKDKQGTLTEGEGPVQLNPSLRSLVLEKSKLMVAISKAAYLNLSVQGVKLY